MSLSILNNIAALYAENNINSTQSKLQPPFSSSPPVRVSTPAQTILPAWP